MPALHSTLSTQGLCDTLRTELADLAYDLERQGRCDAADVVMMLHARVRELSAEAGLEQSTRPEAGFHLSS